MKRARILIPAEGKLTIPPRVYPADRRATALRRPPLGRPKALVASIGKRGFFPGKVFPSAMSKAGRRYKSASRHRIPNEGEQTVGFQSTEGPRCKLKFQVVDVETPLVRTADLTRAGNKVILGDTEGFIENAETNQRIKLYRKGNVYVFRMWVLDQGFLRRGRR